MMQGDDKVWVVKIGGSLFAYAGLADWLRVLATNGGGRIVIVPGGGPFADQVRFAQAHWRFPDSAGHEMALLAMEQFGLMLCGLQSGLSPAASKSVLRGVLRQGGVAVWMPGAMVRAQAGIAANWEMTSDSLSAWLAGQLSAEALILVKSATVNGPVSTAVALAQQGLVDPLFPAVTAGAGFSVRILQRDQSAAMQAMLAANVLSGAVVLPEAAHSPASARPVSGRVAAAPAC
jgi:5-(aminomethyl)-3-furanmethanol phosphate kinase